VGAAQRAENTGGGNAAACCHLMKRHFFDR
jgi:hypothetical protein